MPHDEQLAEAWRTWNPGRRKRKSLRLVGIINCQCCGGPMTLQFGQYGPFYGCTQFPKCRGKRKARPDGSLVNGRGGRRAA